MLNLLRTIGKAISSFMLSVADTAISVGNVCIYLGSAPYIFLSAAADEIRRRIEANDDWLTNIPLHSIMIPILTGGIIMYSVARLYSVAFAIVFGIPALLFHIFAHPIDFISRPWTFVKGVFSKFHDPDTLANNYVNWRLQIDRQEYIEAHRERNIVTTINLNVHNADDRAKRIEMIPKLQQRYVSGQTYHHYENKTITNKSVKDVDTEIQKFFEDMEIKYADLNDTFFKIINGPEIAQPNSAIRPILVKAFSSHPFINQIIRDAASNNKIIGQWFIETVRTIVQSEGPNSEFARWFNQYCVNPDSIVYQWWKEQQYPENNIITWLNSPVQTTIEQSLQALPPTPTDETWEQLIDIKEGLQYAKDFKFFTFGEQESPTISENYYPITIDDAMRLVWVASHDTEKFNAEEQELIKQPLGKEKAIERAKKELLMRLGQNQSARNPYMSGAPDVSCNLGGLERIIDTTKFHEFYPIKESREGYIDSLRNTTRVLAKKELLNNPNISMELVEECRTQHRTQIQWSVGDQLWRIIKERAISETKQKYKCFSEGDPIFNQALSSYENSYRTFTGIDINEAQAIDLGRKIIRNATQTFAKQELLNENITPFLIEQCQFKTSDDTLEYVVSKSLWALIKPKVKADFAETFSLQENNSWIQLSIEAFEKDNTMSIPITFSQDELLSISKKLIENTTVSTGVLIATQEATEDDPKQPLLINATYHEYGAASVLFNKSN